MALASIFPLSHIKFHKHNRHLQPLPIHQRNQTNLSSALQLQSLSCFSTLIRSQKQQNNADIQDLLSSTTTSSTVPRNYAQALSLCWSQRNLELGRQIHAQIFTRGFSSNLILQTKLITMYANCNSLQTAKNLFDTLKDHKNVFLCTALMQSYLNSKLYQEALSVLIHMLSEGISPNEFTFSASLKAVRGLNSSQLGLQVHTHILKTGIVLWDAAVCNCLIHVYSQCEEPDLARKVFDKMPEKNIISWSSMISCYANNLRGDEALSLFRLMRIEFPKTDWILVTSILAVCAQLGNLNHGRELHSLIIKSPINPDVFVWNALVDMYCKCGDTESAKMVFGGMSHRDVVSWNSIISGLGNNGYGEVALEFFHKMGRNGIRVDEITLLHVLSACNHSGMVTEGISVFENMRNAYHVEPRMPHYASMVDLLGRSGKLKEAIEFISKNLYVEVGGSVWGALLNACRVYNNSQLAEIVAAQLVKIGTQNIGYFVVLSNVYASKGRWKDVEKVRKFMKKKGLRKLPGCSWIDVGNKNHVFVAGDHSSEISSAMACIYKLIKDQGYVPATQFVLTNVVNAREKESILCGHSEKLAIVFGIIKTSPRMPIRVFKNLRMCRDCHSAIKFISKLVKRTIVVRDLSRFHHFKDGVCSCRDYW